MTTLTSRSIEKQIAAARRSLKILDHSVRRLGSVVSAGTSGRARLRPRLSAKARASLVLQGRYMGYMRQLKPRQKARVRRIRAAKGVRAAIARARDLVG